MRLTVWGARGSIAVPGPGTLRYGGNTPCVSVEHGNGILVFDAGTGIRALGQALAARRDGAPIELLLSHTHIDHLQGLPFFAPIHDPSARVRIRGPRGSELGLHDTLTRLMTPPFWPAAYAATAARLHVTEITAGDLKTDYFRVSSVLLRHPGVTLGYSVTPTAGGRTVIYMTDNELGQWTGASEWQKELVGFLRHADVLIHDATYGDHEIPDRTGWGHSSASQAAELAIAGGVPKLLLFHHAPEHRDEDIEQLLAEARGTVGRAGATLDVEAASEGFVLDL